MALTDKNIVITPNIGQTADPSIVFSGADTSTTAQNITMRVYPTNNGTLSFEGSNGQIFSINNNFTGTIFSVNDISGIPSIEVLDTGEIRMAQYSGYVRVMSTVAATTVTSGALQVSGGVGVNGDLYARNIYTNGQLVGAVATGSNNLLGGTAGSIPYQESPGTTKFISIGTSGWVLKSNGSTATWSDPVSLTVAVSTTATHLNVGPAGAMPIQVSPGSTSWIPAGTAGQLLVYGTNTATWTNTATIAVGRASTSSYALNLLGGTTGQLVYQSALNTTAFIPLGTAGDLLVSGGTSAPLYQNTLTLAGTTQATSTQTGALVVNGGAGVGGNLWVGGVLYATVQGSINTATNIANGSAGAIPYQSAVGTTNFIGIGANGTLLYSNGLTATWVTTASLVVGTALSAAGTSNITGGSAGAIPYQISSGLTNFIGIGAAGNLLQSNGSTATWISTSTLLVGNAVNAGLATNVAGGAAGALHYQTAAGTTNFIGIGPTGYLLQSNGTTATWQAATSLVTSSTQNINGGTTGAIPYQVSAGVTNFINIGGNGTILRSNGTTATWVTTSTVSVAGADVAFTATRAANLAGTVTGGGMLLYQAAENSTAFLATGTAGTVLVSRAGTPIWQNTLTLAGTTAATNTLTGALTVAGGVGIGGNLYVGGVLYATVQGSINTATNISGGVAGDLLYQSAAGATAKLAIGTVGRVLTSTGSAPQWVTTGSLYVQNAQLAISANNLSAGAAGSLVYQSAVGTTAYLGIGANGTILQSNGTTAAWVSTGSLVAGIAAQAVNIAGGAANQVPYQTAPGVTAFSANLTFNGTALTVGGSATAAAFIPSAASIPTNGVYLPAANTLGLAAGSTSKVTITTTGVGIAKTPGVALDVSGQIRGDNIINTTNTTDATGVATGALQSAGGAGIAKNLYVGGTSFESRTAIGGTIANLFTATITSNALGANAGDLSNALNLYCSNSNADYLEFTNTRARAGTDWQSGGWRIQEKVDSTWMGWMQFNGGQTTANNGGISWGGGSSTVSSNSVLEDMRLDTNGNLVIGSQTSPAGSNGLYVQGNVLVNGTTTAPRIFLNRAGVAGGVSWYSSAYTAWCDYMASAGTTGNGPTQNITAPSGTLVTSWGLRSFVESNAGYGWTWESGTSAIATPVVKAEIRSSDGAFWNAGNIYSAGDVYSSYSDINLKTVLGQIEDPLSMVRKIDTFYYEPNAKAIALGATTGRKVGVSAQSVKSVLPEAVGESALNNEYLTVQYERLVPLLIESVKKLEETIKVQQTQIDQLKNQLQGNK